MAFKIAGLTPGEMLERFSGATGHSQGIVSAIAISASSTYEQFVLSSKKALKWLFLARSRAQAAFPVVSLEPSIIADSVEGGEGVPSPMLTVVGLNLRDLERHVDTPLQTYPALPNLRSMAASRPPLAYNPQKL